MPVALYMDHQVPRAITAGLRARGVDVITASDDGASELDDPALLERAGVLGRVLFTRDDDFLVEAARRQREGVAFPGVVYAHQLRASIGACIRDLESIAKNATPQDTAGQVYYLPLR